MLDALILSAGRGRRLRPLTDTTPKPLLRIGGRALIERHLVQLRAQGFRNVVINLGWLGAQISALLGDGKKFGLRIQYSIEPPGAYGTGGGVKHALALLQSDPFVVINADVLTDYPYANLRIAPDDNLHLVCTPNPVAHKRGDFALADQRLRMPARRGTPAYTYAGIGCFRRNLFTEVRQKRFELRPLIERVIAADRASGELHRGQWLDVGSHKTLQEAQNLYAEDAVAK